MKKLIYTVLALALVSSFTGCSTSKFLNEGEVLYTGVEIEYENPSVVNDEKSLTEKIESELYPKPADKFLGLAYTRQWMYSTIKPKEGKTKGLKYNLKYKFGQKPVLIKEVKTHLMNSINAKTMQDNGFFQCTSSSVTAVEDRKGKITYSINNGRPSSIDSIIFPTTGSDIDTLLAQYPFLRIEEGQRYNLNNFTSDREDLAVYIRNSGYYDFDLKDLFYLLDTAGKSPNFDVYFKIRPPKDDSIHRKFYIRNVNVYITDGNSINPDSNAYKSSKFKGINIHHEFPFISDKTVYANTIMQPFYKFSIDAYKYTSGRFINMDIFDFVNVNYTKVTKDNLDVTIILNPSLTESFSAGIEANTSNRSFLGGSINTAYTNKNANKKADRFVAKANFGTELQNNDGNTQLNIFNYGAELKYEIPRLFFFLASGKMPSEKAPFTFASLNFNHQQWLQYYTLNSMELTYGYDWTNASRFHHDIKPMSLNLIDVTSTTESFQNTLDQNPLLAVSFTDQIIFGSQYRFSFNTKKKSDQKSYFYLQNFFESAGNKSWVVNKLLDPDPTEPYSLFNVPYAQFLKDEVEIRYHNDITADKTFVARLEIGAGFAFGNSTILPFTKKFFMGGPNTIRGFGFRSLGPGSYNFTDGNSRINPIQQSGDMKLMLNAEYRFPIYSIFKGAVFADAGNVWLLRNDPDRPTGLFRLDKFTEQIALSSGFGLRLDLGFFVLRGDLGIPLYTPYLASGDRWITDSDAASFSDWRKENTVFNIAIGYPF